MTRRDFVLSALSALAAAALLASGPGPALAQEAPRRLALKGYDPVAYFTDGRPTQGNARFEHVFDGAVYRFASARHLALFQADPERYLPQYGNLCTASLANGRRNIPDPNYWMVHDGRLYLFASEQGRAVMAANPAQTRAKADANFARLVRPGEPTAR